MVGRASLLYYIFQDFSRILDSSTKPVLHHPDTGVENLLSGPLDTVKPTTTDMNFNIGLERSYHAHQFHNSQELVLCNFSRMK